MQITITVNAFYDWERLPENAEVTEADIRANRVKPEAGGGWLMRVTKRCEEGQVNHALLGISEDTVIALILQELTKEKRVISRNEGISLVVSRHLLQHTAHRSWIKAFEVCDDGPKPEMLEAEAARFIEAGLIVQEDVSELKTTYAQASTPAQIVAFLEERFGVKKKEA
jgi:hypothetical protein